MLRVLGGDRGELALFGRRLILGHRDISLDRHVVPGVSGVGLTSYAIKLELLMKGGIALPVGAQINCFFGAISQREHPSNKATLRMTPPRVVSGNAATFTVIRGFRRLLSLVYSEYCHEAEAWRWPKQAKHARELARAFRQRRRT